MPIEMISKVSAGQPEQMSTALLLKIYLGVVYCAHYHAGVRHELVRRGADFDRIIGSVDRLVEGMASEIDSNRKTKI